MRLITDQTLALVESMANDPTASKALREFHTLQLQDLRRRAESQRRSRRENSFDRFITKLEK